MKSNKGLTLISLLMYIIILTIVIGTISIMIRYFYRNEKENVIQKNTSDQYSRFISYITDDINSGKIESFDVIESNSNISLLFNDESTHQYKFENNKIYNIIYSKDEENQTRTEKYIEICSEVENAIFNKQNENIINTVITIGGKTYNNNFTVK